MGANACSICLKFWKGYITLVCYGQMSDRVEVPVNFSLMTKGFCPHSLYSLMHIVKALRSSDELSPILSQVLPFKCVLSELTH